MSVENVSYEMQNGTFPLPGTSDTAVRIANVDDTTYGKAAILVVANQAISLAASGTGYAPGCFAIDFTGASGTNGDAYNAYNQGTTASPTWVAISLAV
jgi:hypothetical protein